MYFFILFKSYLKNFIIILFSLVAFFVFMDFMINKDKLPDSANLQVLYIFYSGANAAILIYPLSLLLALLLTIVYMIKKNEMIAFLSIGYSLKKLLIPIFIVNLLVTMFFISLQFISSISFNNKVMAMLNGKYFNSVNSNLFFKYNKNHIIFIKKLDVVQKIAYDMKIFILKNNKLIKIYSIDRAQFKKNLWEARKAKIYILTKNEIIVNSKYLNILNGFKPAILDKLESKDGMGLKIAFQTLFLLMKEGVNTSVVKTYIYNAIIPPITFILLTLVIFLNAPIHIRISNISLYLALSIFSAIILWGMFLLVRNISISGIINPDIAFFTPFLLLLSISIYYFRKI